MIEEFYDKIGGSYSEAISRMLNDERILKYLKFYLADDSFPNLKKAIEEKNVEEAFNSAHTLKGVCKNMSFSSLSKVAEEITEVLRARNLNEAIIIFQKVEEEYSKVIIGINEII